MSGNRRAEANFPGSTFRDLRDAVPVRTTGWCIRCWRIRLVLVQYQPRHGTPAGVCAECEQQH